MLVQFDIMTAMGSLSKKIELPQRPIAGDGVNLLPHPEVMMAIVSWTAWNLNPIVFMLARVQRIVGEAPEQVLPEEVVPRLLDGGWTP